MDARKHQSAGAAAVDVSALALFDDVIRAAVQAGASDIHLEPRPKGVFVRFRKGGALIDGYDLPGMAQSLGVAEPPVISLPRVVKRLLNPDESLSEIEIARPREGRIAMHAERLDLRVSILPTALGESIVLRISRTPGDGPALHELGFSDEMLDAVTSLVRSPRGLMLVCGSAGCGTEVTLRTLMRHVDHPSKRLLAIDEQGEIIASRVTLVQVAQADGMSFAEGLRCALRHDPDVVMVGHVRDGETARLAARAARTGPLVLAATDGDGAADALVRLIERAGSAADVAETCIGVLAQRLVRRVCSECARHRPVSERFVQLAAHLGRSGEVATLPQCAGCAHCGHTGHQGYVGVFELLLLSAEMRDALRSSMSATAFDEAARAGGMRALLHDAFDKAVAGLISEDDLLCLAFPDIDMEKTTAALAPPSAAPPHEEALSTVAVFTPPQVDVPAFTAGAPLRASVTVADDPAPWAEFSPSDDVAAPPLDEAPPPDLFGPPADIADPVVPPSFDSIPLELVSDVDIAPRPRRATPARESADVSRRLRRL